MEKFTLNVIKKSIKMINTNKNKLIVWDIPKKNINFLKNEILTTNQQCTGLYFLINKIDFNDKKKYHIYIGESDDVKKRVLQHINDNIKIFNRIVLIYFDAINDKLDKDQIRYLEKKFIIYFRSISKKWNSDENKEKGKNIKLPIMIEEETNQLYDFILYAMKLLDYEVYYNDEENDEENVNIVKDEIQSNEKESIDVWILNAYNNKKYNAKYIPIRNKGKILVDKEIFFKTKCTNEIFFHRFKKSLQKSVKENKIFMNKELINISDEIEIKINSNTLFAPSTISTWFRGNSSNGYECWKDSEGNLIQKYRK